MKELVSFIGNQYLTASEQLTMHCKDKAKEIVSFQVLPPDTIYAVINDNNEIKLKEENELLLKPLPNQRFGRFLHLVACKVLPASSSSVACKAGIAKLATLELSTGLNSRSSNGMF